MTAEFADLRAACEEAAREGLANAPFDLAPEEAAWLVERTTELLIEEGAYLLTDGTVVLPSRRVTENC